LEQTCKPNPVSALRQTAIIHLGEPLPIRSSDLPEFAGCVAAPIERAAQILRIPIWSCTTRSLPGRACYHTRRWALTPPFHPSPLRGWSVFCCTCRRPQFANARTLSGPLPFGVRTFLFRQKSRSDRPACSECLAPKIIAKFVEHLNSGYKVFARQLRRFRCAECVAIEQVAPLRLDMRH